MESPAFVVVDGASRNCPGRWPTIENAATKVAPILRELRLDDVSATVPDRDATTSDHVSPVTDRDGSCF